MTGKSPPPGSNHFAGGGGLWTLDIVRGVAAQLVVVGHGINVILPRLTMHRGPSGLLEARDGIFYPQSFAVVLFFNVSGYLITATFLAKRARPDWSLRHFLSDRFARIFTALVPLILLLLIVDQRLPRGAARQYSMGDATLLDAARNLSMTFDHPLLNALARAIGAPWLGGSAFGTAPQLWTVAIEWWIYVVFGCFAFGLTKRSSSLLGRLILLGLALPVIAAAFRSHPALPVAWIVGMVIRLAEPRLVRLSGRTLFVLAAAGCGGALLRLPFSSWNAYDMIFCAGVAAPLFAAVVAERKGLLWRPASPRIARPIGFMADVSYALYLIPLSVLFHFALQWPALVGEPMALIALFIVCNAVATSQRRLPPLLI